MKRKILVSSVLVALISLSTSNTSAQDISLGARFGLNFANVSESGGGATTTYSTRTSILLGGYATIMFQKNMGIQPELFYFGSGANYSSSTLKFNYISLPVFFRYNFNEQFHLLVGPQLGILASAKVKSGNTTVDVKDQTSGSDFGGAIGVGYDYEKFNFGIRYYNGFSNMSKNAGTTDKNHSFQIVVGYKLWGK
ncbi:MAG: PorT family protein [Bacteroidetes bacterium]|nr:PorT family protein [Bacteroidota bacterium]